VESLAVQFPSRAFAHIAPPWAQALHASPAQVMRFRPSHPSDDLMLTERDLDAAAHAAFADEGETHSHSQRPR
jgi:hypothetical protein